MAYKEPATLALGTVSVVMLWLSMWKTAARSWMALAGALGVALVAATVVFALPILERTMREGGTRLTDGEIVLDVQAWQLWCKLRLMLLVAAWAASLMALVRSSSRQLSEWLPTSVRL
jgi:hypothetical protein